MEIDPHDSDGSENFWPGYVDAVTNLVLNLLFLLTIMTVAVFMFALELGRASLGGSGNTPTSASKASQQAKQPVTSQLVKEKEAAINSLSKQIDALDSASPADKAALRAALKREIEFLNSLHAQQSGKQTSAGSPTANIPATSAVPKPQKGMDKLLSTEGEIMVRFSDEAVTLTKTELSQLRQALKPVVEKGRARIYVEVPSGFSEARRMGFYRAMAVRNLLIDMKVPQKQIDVVVREGSSRANASLVRVTP